MVSTGAGAPAPTHTARLALRRFNCLNCHSRDGEGGISVELANEMRLLSKAELADDVLPPLLTGIGHKSRTPWLKSVLLQGGRARSWMQLRMPRYGEANVGLLPESLAFLEGLTADDSIHKVPLSASNIANGKVIVGKGGLGCISCHDIAGIPNSGTRGPDLATINQRVRFDWYERWLHQPLRMAPGTRMPQAFVDNKSTLTTVLGGNPQAQAEAMWAYLSLGTGLPLPDGLEPPKGLIIAVKERPEVLRTFMTEAGSKAIAVGYPGGVSVAFSADQCRLAYSWAGNFLDASPVWNNRGGAPAKLLGPKFWSGPTGHPWGLTVNPYLPPDFQARANNPVFGTPFPLEPARTYNGPRAVEFLGYSLDKSGRPTFRYKLQENDKGAVLRAAETPLPLKSGVATGIARRFSVEAPGGYVAWLFAGTTPEFVDNVGSKRGKPQAIRHRAFVDQVSPADLNSVDAGLRRDCIDQAFAHECRFLAAGRAVRAARRLVRQPDVCPCAISRDAIGTGQHGRRKIGDGCRVRAHVGAVVVKEFIVDAENAAVPVDRGPDLVALLARMIGGDQMLAPVLDPFNGSFEFQGGRANKHILGIHFAAYAEAAADMALVRVHLSGWRPSMSASRSRFQCGTFAAPCISRTSLASSYRAMAPRVSIGTPLCRPISRSSATTILAARKAASMSPDFFSITEVSVSWRSSNGPGGPAASRTTGSGSISSLDQVGRILGNIWIGSEDSRYRLPDITHVTLRQRGLLVGLKLHEPGQAKSDRRNVGDVGMRPDGMNAWQGKSGFCIDCFQ